MPYFILNICVSSLLRLSWYFFQTFLQTIHALSDGGRLIGFSNVSFPGENGTCGSSLAQGTSCTLEVTCAPAVTGTYSDRLIIAYDNGSETIDLNLDVLCQAVP